MLTGFYNDPKYINKVGKLNKALYGLKQAPRLWYNYLDKALAKLGFIKCPHDEAVFIRPSIGIIIVAYVDDKLVFEKDDFVLKELEKDLADII